MKRKIEHEGMRVFKRKKNIGKTKNIVDMWQITTKQVIM
jgi:hypothetical protein